MKHLLLTALLSGMSGVSLWAQSINMPIIQTKYTADPAPYVHGDTVYLYTTHDEDYSEGFMMKDWLLYTSTDMVNWQDHGVVASLKDFPWYKGGQWCMGRMCGRTQWQVVYVLSHSWTWYRCTCVRFTLWTI